MVPGRGSRDRSWSSSPPWSARVQPFGCAIVSRGAHDVQPEGCMMGHDEEDRVERSIELGTPVDEVWSALTEPRRLSAWLGGAVEDLELRPGGRGTVRRVDGAVRRLVVEKVDPGRLLGLRWWPFEEDRPPAAGMGTRVEFELRPTKDGCVLRVAEFPPLGGVRSGHGVVGERFDRSDARPRNLRAAVG